MSDLTSRHGSTRTATIAEIRQTFGGTLRHRLGRGAITGITRDTNVVIIQARTFVRDGKTYQVPEVKIFGFTQEQLNLFDDFYNTLISSSRLVLDGFRSVVDEMAKAGWSLNYLSGNVAAVPGSK